MYFTSAFVIASLAHQALAGTVGLPAVAKRGAPPPAGESIHLVNCGSTWSLVAYCANDKACFGNDNMSPNNICITGINGFTTWEKSGKSCQFQSGVNFKWSINSDAKSQAYGTNVGTGSNGFHNMVCKKDSKPHIFNFSGMDCKSIYWCQDSD
ncbi:hypothetical protein GQ53DRAFT_838278 [Thozetella sp. PMI_491]|nr:hypothetical protein GQ53DRAFT_838278 [Thozetella sp. PMI_491]